MKEDVPQIRLIRYELRDLLNEIRKISNKNKKCYSNLKELELPEIEKKLPKNVIDVTPMIEDHQRNLDKFDVPKLNKMKIDLLSIFDQLYDEERLLSNIYTKYQFLMERSSSNKKHGNRRATINDSASKEITLDITSRGRHSQIEIGKDLDSEMENLVLENSKMSLDIKKKETEDYIPYDKTYPYNPRPHIKFVRAKSSEENVEDQLDRLSKIVAGIKEHMKNEKSMENSGFDKKFPGRGLDLDLELDSAHLLTKPEPATQNFMPIVSEEKMACESINEYNLIIQKPTEKEESNISNRLPVDISQYSSKNNTEKEVLELLSIIEVQEREMEKMRKQLHEANRKAFENILRCNGVLEGEILYEDSRLSILLQMKREIKKESLDTEQADILKNNWVSEKKRPFDLLMSNDCENLKNLLSYIYQLQETIACSKLAIPFERNFESQSFQQLGFKNCPEEVPPRETMETVVKNIKTKTLFVNKRKRNCFSMFEKINPNSWNSDENKENIGDEIFETQETLLTEGHDVLTKNTKISNTETNYEAHSEGKEKYLSNLIENNLNEKTRLEIKTKELEKEANVIEIQKNLINLEWQKILNKKKELQQKEKLLSLEYELKVNAFENQNTKDFLWEESGNGIHNKSNNSVGGLGGLSLDGMENSNIYKLLES